MIGPVGDTFEAPICDAAVHSSVLIVSCQSLTHTCQNIVIAGSRSSYKTKAVGDQMVHVHTCDTEHSIQACQFCLAGIISVNQPLNESGKIEILVSCCTILCSILVSLLGIHIITS